MGLEPGENLLAEEGLLPGYRPADLVRQGFFVVDDKIAIDRDDAIFDRAGEALFDADGEPRSEEHTYELKSLMRISYAVFCWTKKNRPNTPYIATHSKNTHR